MEEKGELGKEEEESAICSNPAPGEGGRIQIGWTASFVISIQAESLAVSILSAEMPWTKSGFLITASSRSRSNMNIRFPGSRGTAKAYEE